MIPLWKFQAFDRSIMVRSQLIWLCPILNTLKHNSSNKSLKIHKVGLSYVDNFFPLNFVTVVPSQDAPEVMFVTDWQTLWLAKR